MEAGQRFGRLTAHHYVGAPRNQWQFVCDCGEKVVREATKVRSGHTSSCGCYRSDRGKEIVKGYQVARVGNRWHAEDLTGRTYNRLTVTSLHHIADNGARHWLCRCDCGTERIVEGASIKRGKVKSCGCLRREMSRVAVVLAQNTRRGAKVQRTQMGTKVLRMGAVLRHRMDGISDGAKPGQGPSAYGRPDLFAFAWPPRVEREVAA